MNKFDIYVIIIIIMKISFIILALAHIYYKFFDKNDVETDENIVYWKDRVDYVFKILMAILLFYIFNPYYDNTYLIDGETKILFYLFGIILIITANWTAFIKDTRWLNLSNTNEN